MKPLLLITCLTICAASPATATVAYIEGDVYVDAQQVQQPDFPIKPGSVVRTEKGRAEVHFGRNDAFFRFDRHQVVDENFCKVRVYKGAAGAPMLSFVWVLTPGKTVDLGSCGDFTPRDEFNIDDADDLTRWSRERAGVRP
jgi:hypothetical protein